MKRNTIVLGIGACLAVSGAIAYTLHAPATIDINNAFVAGHMITLSSPVAGIVESINVQKSATYPAGRLAFLISDRAASEKVHSAELGLRAAFLQSGRDCLKLGTQEARVQLRGLEAEMADTKVVDAKSLSEQGFVSKRFVEQQVLNEKTARLTGQIELIEKRSLETSTGGKLPSSEELVNAIERVRIALLERQHASVRVGSTVFVHDIHVLIGQWVDAGSLLATVIPVEAPRVQANIIESQIGAVFVGQRALVTVDGLDKTILTGTVEAIVPATAATFSPLQRNNVDSTWMKVSQRIPVLVRLDGPADRLARVRIGQSANVQLLTLAPGAVQPVPQAAPSLQTNATNDLDAELNMLIRKAKAAVNQQLRLPPTCKLFG